MVCAGEGQTQWMQSARLHIHKTPTLVGTPSMEQGIPIESSGAQEVSLTFLFFYLFILLLAVLGLCSCVQTFSSCGVGGYSLVAVCRLLIAVASLVVEHQLWSVWAQ